MYQSLYSEKSAADDALSGWKKMLQKAVHPKNGDIVLSSVEERLKSLDAAWTRFDKAHYKLLQEHPEVDREKEKEVWEARLEEYCLTREEAVEVLKGSGLDVKDFDKMKLTDDEKLNYENPHSEHKHEKSAHQPSSSGNGEKHQGLSDEHHHHQSPRPNPKLQKSVSATSKKATQMEKKASKQSLGSYQKPRLPDEIRQRAAIRDDLIISGHKDYNSLFASNDTVQESFTVNILGAPNDSTTTCGCDNINCPFCNLVQSIRNRDPSL